MTPEQLGLSPEEYERLSPTARKHLELRGELMLAALEEGLFKGRVIRQRVQRGYGVDFETMPTLAPLTARERTAVLRKLYQKLDLRQ